MIDALLFERLVDAFGVWEQARATLHQMLAPEEVRLILAMADGAHTAAELATVLNVSEQEAAALLLQCYHRCIVDRESDGSSLGYRLADYYSFVAYYAKFEDWNSLPAEDRRALDERCLHEFIQRTAPNVSRVARGQEPEGGLPNDTVMLLPELEEMLDAATDFVVQPCDCRRLGQHCDRPVETCLWLDDAARRAMDRGHGRVLTREEAKELVRWADKKGLMHTTDGEWRANGLHAICNCCGCDCYPFRAARALDSKGVWPRQRYLAVHDVERCSQCGLCVRRCHFEAFYFDGSWFEIDGKRRAGVRLDPDRCWGCGLCVNTCPEEAITMEPMDS